MIKVNYLECAIFKYRLANNNCLDGFNVFSNAIFDLFAQIIDELLFLWWFVLSYKGFIIMFVNI